MGGGGEETPRVPPAGLGGRNSGGLAAAPPAPAATPSGARGLSL